MSIVRALLSSQEHSRKPCIKSANVGAGLSRQRGASPPLRLCTVALHVRLGRPTRCIYATRGVHIVAAAVSCRAQALWQGGTDRAPELLVLAGEPVGAFAYGVAPGAAEP